MKTTKLSKSESLAAADRHRARGWLAALVLLLVCGSAWGQVNSGSTGADGAFNPHDEPGGGIERPPGRQ